MVNSPLTNKPGILVKDIPVKELVNSYQKSFDLDVSYLFTTSEKVSIYQCPDTGYRFFHPSDIAGDGKFYEHLQQYEWYYMPWKWEHQQATSFLKPGMKVLEVGCAQGSFLKKIAEDFEIEATGLELNEKAAREANSLGLNVLTETIQEHALHNTNKYDLVCSFQVVEHVADLHSFIKAQIDVLKSGGKMVISVPNNAGFLGKDHKNILNYPPHHMGLWDKRSLKNLCNIYDLKYVNCFFEPLQDYHKKYFKNITIKQLPLGNILFFSKAYSKILKYTFIENFFFSLFSKSFKGFTVQVIYEKK